MIVMGAILMLCMMLSCAAGHRGCDVKGMGTMGRGLVWHDICRSRATCLVVILGIDALARCSLLLVGGEPVRISVVC